MGTIWSEERIREELARLDRLTRLQGAENRIIFNNAKNVLGQFRVTAGKQLVFIFSGYWFQNPEWPPECALDVIRHEYAHYMDFVLYGNFSHGRSWKECCIRVGAHPVRLYDEEIDARFRKLHRQEDALMKRMDVYHTGMWISHPKFGPGQIRQLEGEGLLRYAQVQFAKAGLRRLDLKWVEANCKRLIDADETGCKNVQRL